MSSKKAKLDQKLTFHNETLEIDTESPEVDIIGIDRETKKKTKGRCTVPLKLIQDKQRRHTTFSKRKKGLLKKSSELSILTGTQVMCVVASETGQVFTYGSRKFNDFLNSANGRMIIQSCLQNDDSGSDNNSTDKVLAESKNRFKNLIRDTYKLAAINAAPRPLPSEVERNSTS